MAPHPLSPLKALGFVLVFGGIAAVQLGNRTLAPVIHGAPDAPVPTPDPAPTHR